MIQPLKIWGLRQIRVPDFWLALFAFLGVVLIGVMAGIVLGVVLSLVLLVRRLSTPHTAFLGTHPERGYVDQATNPDAAPIPGTLIFRVDGPLVFASVDSAVDALRTRALLQGEPPQLVVLDFESTYEIDVTAADTLAGLVDDLRQAGIEVRFAAAHQQVRDYARKLALPELAGLVTPYPTIDSAIRG